MKSSTATLAVLALAVCALTTVSAANMDKYLKRTGAKFLDEMAKEEGVHKLPSGMLYKVGRGGAGRG
jgi:FKBP-type peptidyl-prolyl cis-trans isomerase